MINLLTTLALSLTLLFYVPNNHGYSVGDKALDFKLKNIDGNFISLATDATNKGYIIVFTCNSCPTSVAYEDRIIALDNKYRSKGYPVIAINPNDPVVKPADSFENMKKRAREKAFPFAYVFDATQEITLAYGATNTPHAYVVERVEQDYVVRYIGAIDNNSRKANLANKHYVEDAVDNLLIEKPVEVSATKAIGCSIKWSAASKEKRDEG